VVVIVGMFFVYILYTNGFIIKLFFSLVFIHSFSTSSNGHVGFHVKEVSTVYDLFRTRHSLFRQIYVHRATKAVEFMINDVLIEANRVWNNRLANAIRDPNEYMHLTDSIIYEIEHTERNNVQLAEAHRLLKNLRRRQLYRFVDEYIVPVDLAKKVCFIFEDNF
jgi:deoxynucleoside triphosphate triphosphohydrolase SAMHD1